MQISPRVGGSLTTRNVFNLGNYGVAAKPPEWEDYSPLGMFFNLGDYGVAAKPPSGRIALHLECF